MSKKLDAVYFLVQRLKGRKPVVFYSPPGTNPGEAWHRAALWDNIEGGGTGHISAIDRSYVKNWMASMTSAGWRSEKLELFTKGDQA